MLEPGRAALLGQSSQLRRSPDRTREARDLQQLRLLVLALVPSEHRTQGHAVLPARLRRTGAIELSQDRQEWQPLDQSGDRWVLLQSLGELKSRDRKDDRRRDADHARP